MDSNTDSENFTSDTQAGTDGEMYDDEEYTFALVNSSQQQCDIDIPKFQSEAEDRVAIINSKLHHLDEGARLFFNLLHAYYMVAWSIKDLRPADLPSWY